MDAQHGLASPILSKPLRLGAPSYGVAAPSYGVAKDWGQGVTFSWGAGGCESWYCRGLRCVSPEEMFHAYIFAVHDAIKAGSTKAQLEKWLTVALKVPFKFEIFSGESDVYFRSLVLRNDIEEDAKAMARTPYQWVYIVINFKKLQEASSGGSKLSAEAVSKLHQSNTDLEFLSKDFIEKCISVYDNLFSVDAVRELVEWCDAEYGVDTPFANIMTLYCLCSRVKTNADKIWLLTALVDAVRMKDMARPLGLSLVPPDAPVRPTGCPTTCRQPPT